MKKFVQNICEIIKKGAAYGAVLFLLAQPVIGQQSPLTSQYTFSRLVINPAYAGSQDQLSITAIHRRQWDNFAGAPNTNTFLAHKSLKNKNVGVGLMVSSDKIGVHADQRLYAMYSYKIRMARGTLAMGLQAGFSRLQSDFSQLNLRGEDQLVSGFRNTFNPNFGTGIYYSTSSFYAGLSAPYLLNNSLNRGMESLGQGKEKRYYYLTVGKVFTLNPLVKVMPSALVRTQEGNASSLEAGVNFILDDMLTVGAAYRSEDALVSILKLNISDNLSLGYSYDHTLSDIGQYSDGSHEFMINYHLPYSKKCHTYF